jgi:hypothetical protein
MFRKYLRAHWLAQVVISALVAVPGLLLGPAIMKPAYQVMRPSFQGTTLIWVEVLFALLIDLPLTVLATAALTTVTGCTRSQQAVQSGLLFLGIFFTMILACIAVGDRVHFIGELALSSVFPTAVSSARQTFGSAALATMMALYLVFDVTICGLGAMVGYRLGRLLGDLRSAVAVTGSSGQ